MYSAFMYYSIQNGQQVYMLLSCDKHIIIVC